MTADVNASGTDGRAMCAVAESEHLKGRVLVSVMHSGRHTDDARSRFYRGVAVYAFGL
jgi:hypothetical protein